MTTAPTAMADAPRARRRPRPSSSFLRFLLRRAAALVLLAVGITLVVFVLTQLVPSNAVATNLGEQAAADPAAVAAFKAHYGLDKPLPVRYWLYLQHLVQGDLGQSSLTHDAVTHDLGQFIPATAELALYSIVIAAVFGIAFGVIAAMRRNRPADHVLRVVSLGGISMPTFWIALVALYLGFFKLGWFPGADRLDPGVLPPPQKTGLYTIDALLAGQWGLFVQALHHLVLPALVLAAFNVSLLTRYTRSGTWLQKYRDGKMAFGLSLWGPDYPDPLDYLAFLPGELVGTRAGWTAGSDATLERLAAKARITTASKARQTIYRQIQRRLNSVGPFFPLLQPTQVFVSTKDLKNAVFNAQYQVDVTQVTPK